MQVERQARNMEVDTRSTTSAVTAAPAAAATPISRNPVTVVDLSRPTFTSASPSVNAGVDALIKLASSVPELRTFLVLEQDNMTTNNKNNNKNSNAYIHTNNNNSNI
mmetsp:Transcript_51927/g.52901  ORF Transcript_51927/g.52901 Transcript_51927/m.52901 type:complete len:107 (+) Transcript_51927:58-378(+)